MINREWRRMKKNVLPSGRPDSVLGVLVSGRPKKSVLGFIKILKFSKNLKKIKKKLKILIN